MATLSLDADLSRRAAQAAAAQGKSLDQFVGEAIESALAAVGVRQTVKNGLPVMLVSDATPAIDPAQVQRSLQEEGF